MKGFAITSLLGLAFLLAILPFTQGEVDHYKLEIDEKGTRFSEEIEVDEKGDEAVFRVPSHNDVDGANFYHDFKMRVTVTRIPPRKVCYISELDSSLSSPRKLKEDVKRAASQTGQLPVTTKSNLMMVTGPANRHFLPQKILDFCGILPIYNVETVEKFSLMNETSGSGIRHRIARQTSQNIVQYPQCNNVNTLAYVENCMNKKWDLSCKIQSYSCHYTIKCINQQPRNSEWKCRRVHLIADYPICCDLICPSK